MFRASSGCAAISRGAPRAPGRRRSASSSTASTPIMRAWSKATSNRSGATGWRRRQCRRAAPLPIDLEPRVWFNSAVRSRDYLVPGLIAINMTLTGALLTALVIAREWERGTMEALMVTRVTIREILLAKLLPYFTLGMGGMAASVAIAVWLFAVPLRGSLGVLIGAASLFLLAALGMGLLISSFARNQFVAGQIAIITTFLP